MQAQGELRKQDSSRWKMACYGLGVGLIMGSFALHSDLLKIILGGSGILLFLIGRSILWDARRGSTTRGETTTDFPSSEPYRRPDAKHTVNRVRNGLLTILLSWSRHNRSLLTILLYLATAVLLVIRVPCTFTIQHAYPPRYQIYTSSYVWLWDVAEGKVQLVTLALEQIALLITASTAWILLKRPERLR